MRSLLAQELEAGGYEVSGALAGDKIRRVNVAMDLDGTLANWGNGPAAAAVGEWDEGAADAVRTLLERGDRVVVHTCRATWPAGGGWQAVAEFLHQEGFEPWLVAMGEEQQTWGFVERTRDGWGYPTMSSHPGRPGPLAVGIWIGRGKPIAHAYVDDRAVHHKGDWQETLLALGMPPPAAPDRA